MKLLSPGLNFSCPTCGYFHSGDHSSFLADENGTYLYLPWYVNEKGIKFYSFVCLRCGSISAIAPKDSMDWDVGRLDEWETRAIHEWKVAGVLPVASLRKLIEEHGMGVLQATGLKPLVFWALFTRGLIFLPQEIMNMVRAESEDALMAMRLLWSTKIDRKGQDGRSKPVLRSSIDWRLLALAVLYSWGVNLLVAFFESELATFFLYDLPRSFSALIPVVFGGYYAYTRATTRKSLHSALAVAGYFLSIVVLIGVISLILLK